MRTLVIIGAGPRGTGLLERLAANAAELLPTGQRLHIHLVDPHPPGGGRIWRERQSPLLRMNSMAEDVTMFTDESSAIEGPIRPGPSLAQWAADQPSFPPYRPVADPALRAELARLAPTDFATRRAQSAYLDWVFRRAVAELPAPVTLTVHRESALALAGPADGPQRVTLTSGRELMADQVVLTLGHLGSAPDERHAATAAFARRHGRYHLPPAFSSEAELAAVAPGEQLILRGFGLAFVDLVALFTEGRGGRFAYRPDGSAIYHPSGREPVLHVGSRRGVPYHSKTDYRLQGPPAPLPRYFGPATVEELLNRPGPLELRRDAWPLMAKEIGFGYYHELFHAHPERTTLPWAAFLADYDRYGWYQPELAALVERAVPQVADRLDFERLDHPLAGLRFADPEQLQQHLRQYIRADADRRADPAYSADLGAFLALLSLYGQLPRLLAAGRLTARSIAGELDGWWHGFFSFLASGPPGFRLRELLALSEAGVVRFLGADLSVTEDEANGTFVASSPSLPGHRVRATALIEAYLPRHSLQRTEDQVLAQLLRAGRLAEEVVVDPDFTHRSGLLTHRPRRRPGARPRTRRRPAPAPPGARPAHQRPRLRRLRPSAHQRPGLQAERRGRPRPAARAGGVRACRFTDDR